MFKRIVVGCDGSPGARDAVALAASIASATGAGISLVGVYPPSLFPVPGSTDRRTLRTHAELALRRERDELAPDALLHTAADLSVPRALRHYAEHWHADLVIVGCSRAAPNGHVQIGRDGRQLVYDAPFSLALPTRGLHRHAVVLRRIGVGYDGGPEAQAALSLATGLARAAGAALVIHSIVEDLIPPLSVEQSIVREDWAKLWEAERESALARAESAASALGIAAEASATVGDPGTLLRALTNEVDLIVVGSRRWGPVARLVSGGVGETLVADARCPILIVPRPHTADDAHAEPPLIEQVRA
jgi:nucleotide-binding universal stress UspA family protein